MNALTQSVQNVPIHVCHVVQGKTVYGTERAFGQPGSQQFSTPALELSALSWSRTAPGPAFELPSDDIIDLLVATGERLRSDSDGLLAEAFAKMTVTGDLEVGVLKRAYADLASMFRRDALQFLLDGELGGKTWLDDWVAVRPPRRNPVRVRAFPPRLVHILAGNVPGVAAISIIRGALSKGVNLLKLPANDLFSATAILRTMSNIAPDHPVCRSFSAVYWRGGDAVVEGTLFRPQFFDKLVAWGGEGTVRNAKQYIAPGFELIAFDPKSSISFIGAEAFCSDATLNEAAQLGATDASAYNQSACTASRFQFVEGSVESIDRYCQLLQEQLGVERHTSSMFAYKVRAELREAIDALRDIDPEYRVWGQYDGKGLVIRSPEPVDFYPDGKIVNVVPVASLMDAVRFATIATQTVGVYPPSRKTEVRNALAAAGVQRIVSLGHSLGQGPGIPHDGFLPLHRFMRWVTDEG